MSTAGYLQDAKNQQKRLAETITSKGITATAIEKYTDLVDKVAQIEELKGEEKVLENFTNILDEPKSIVQLEYPNDTLKTLNAKLGSKNLFDKSTSERGWLDSGTGNVLTNTTDYTSNFILIENLKTYFCTGTKVQMWCCLYDENKNFLPPFLLGTGSIGSFSLTIDNPKAKYMRITTPNISESDLETVQVEIGSTATAYTPYISDFSTVTVNRCGKNILEYPYVETTLTRNGLTFTDNKDGTITVNGTATADTQFRLQDTIIYPNNFNPFNSLIGKKVYISGSPEGSTKDTYAIQWISAGVYGNGVMTVTKSSYYRFAIFVKSGITVENLVFKPQIELGTTATSYEPYQGQTYTSTPTGEVTGITNLYPTTTFLTDNAGVVFEQITGGFYKEILPSTDKNGITKVYQPSVDSTIDSNIKPENIKKGVKILGILGTYDGN